MKKLPEPRRKRYDAINGVWHIYYDHPFFCNEYMIRRQIDEIRKTEFDKLNEATIAEALSCLGIPDFKLERRQDRTGPFNRWWSTKVDIHYHFTNSSMCIGGLDRIFKHLSMGGSAWAWKDGIGYQHLHIV